VIPRYHPGWVAHGLAVGTAEDVVRFLNLLFVERRVVASELVDEMLVGAPVAENHPWMVKPTYGLGLMMDPASPFGVVAGHTGGGPGYATAAYHFADVDGRRVSAVALVNRDGSDVATDIVFSLVRELAAG
jgi:D-alanyl-D-alanine carboxypeptidase